MEKPFYRTFQSSSSSSSASDGDIPPGLTTFGLHRIPIALPTTRAPPSSSPSSPSSRPRGRLAHRRKGITAPFIQPVDKGPGSGIHGTTRFYRYAGALPRDASGVEEEEVGVVEDEVQGVVVRGTRATEIRGSREARAGLAVTSQLVLKELPEREPPLTGQKLTNVERRRIQRKLNMTV